MVPSILDCEFTRKYTLEERKKECEKIFSKYSDRIPLIVVNAPSSNLPDIKGSKFLMPNDLTIGHLIYVLKSRINMDQNQAIFLFVNGIIPPTSGLISDIYEKHKAEDGFVYFTVTAENTFG